MNIEEHYDNCRKEGFQSSVFLKSAAHKGVGVFASKPFLAGDTIEMCHSIIFEWQAKFQRDSTVGRYAFALGCHCNPSPTRPVCLLNCPVNGTRYILPLGYGACYNSADRPEDANARYEIYPDSLLIAYFATKPIEVGDEIVTWFGQGYYENWCKPMIPKKKK